MNWKAFTLPLLPLCFAALLFAQAQRTPQPAPELKKLDYFVGTWKTEAQTKPGPMGPGGTFNSTDRYEWQKGNFFVIGHSEFTSSGMGNGVDLSVLGYDPARKVYTYHSFNSAGEDESATGTFTGDTWTWISGEQSPVKWRYIQKVVSAKSFTSKLEGTQDGTNWATIFEAKVTKQ